MHKRIITSFLTMFSLVALVLSGCASSVTVNIEEPTLTLAVGDSLTLDVSVSGIDEEQLVFASENTNVVTVDENGIVFAKSAGATVITVTGGAVVDTIDVTVVVPQSDVEFRVADGFIQWRIEGTASWTNLISVESLTGEDGATGPAGPAGINGAAVEFSVVNDAIVWRYVGTTLWTSLVQLEALVGEDGIDGVDGREIELRVNLGNIEWRYEGDTNWTVLIALSNLTGATGSAGIDGTDGEDGKDVELLNEDGVISWRLEGDSEWQVLIDLSDLLDEKFDYAGYYDVYLSSDEPYFSNYEGYNVEFGYDEEKDDYYFTPELFLYYSYYWTSESKMEDLNPLDGHVYYYDQMAFIIEYEQKVLYTDTGAIDENYNGRNDDQLLVLDIPVDYEIDRFYDYDYDSDYNPELSSYENEIEIWIGRYFPEYLSAEIVDSHDGVSYAYFDEEAFEIVIEFNDGEIEYLDYSFLVEPYFNSYEELTVIPEGASNVLITMNSITNLVDMGVADVDFDLTDDYGDTVLFTDFYEYEDEAAAGWVYNDENFRIFYSGYGGLYPYVNYGEEFIYIQGTLDFDLYLSVENYENYPVNVVVEIVENLELDNEEFFNLSMFNTGIPQDYVMVAFENGGVLPENFYPYTNESRQNWVYLLKGTSMKLPIPVLPGYRFLGWFTGDSVNDGQVTDAFTFTENVTLFARWAHLEYAVEFWQGETYLDWYEDYFGYGLWYPNYLVSTPTYYEFDGWYDEYDNYWGDGVDDYYFIPVVYETYENEDGDLDLYAHFTPIDYSVTYHLNDGTNDDENPDWYNVESGQVSLADATKNHATFLGWTEDEAGEGSYITELPTEGPYNITLYAQWEMNEYTITFEENGGSEVTDIDAVYGDSVTEPTDPTKEGYDFDGWYTDEALTTEYTFSTMGEDTTLYAKWKEIEYTITFDENGGDEITDIEAAAGDDVTAPTTPTKTGYTFVGWYSDEELTTTYTFTTMPIDGATVYVKWAPIQITITFDLDGGVGQLGYTAFADSLISGSIRDTFVPTKEGYVFDGWLTSDDLPYDFAVKTTMPTSDITLYASWVLED